MSGWSTKSAVSSVRVMTAPVIDLPHGAVDRAFADRQLGHRLVLDGLREAEGEHPRPQVLDRDGVRFRELLQQRLLAVRDLALAGRLDLVRAPDAAPDAVVERERPLELGAVSGRERQLPLGPPPVAFEDDRVRTRRLGRGPLTALHESPRALLVVVDRGHREAAAGLRRAHNRPGTAIRSATGRRIGTSTRSAPSPATGKRAARKPSRAAAAA